MTSFDPTDTTSIRVLIADDHQLIRDMVGAFLLAQKNFSVMHADSYDNVSIVLLENDPFDVVLLDVQMPGMDGIRCIEKLVTEFPHTSFVVFSGSASNLYVQEALKVGAKGYIPKTIPFKSLLNTIMLVASGEIFVPSTFVVNDRPESSACKFDISEIELRVLRMVCAGMANKEIAREMGKTEVLIKMHMRGICKKLGAKNRTQAAIIALREQLA